MNAWGTLVVPEVVVGNSWIKVSQIFWFSKKYKFVERELEIMLAG